VRIDPCKTGHHSHPKPGVTNGHKAHHLQIKYQCCMISKKQCCWKVRLVLRVTTCTTCNDSTITLITLAFNTPSVRTYQIRTNRIFQFGKLWTKIKIVVLELEKYAEIQWGENFFFAYSSLFSGFDSRRGHWDFSPTSSFRPHCRPGFD
jgi:hypothetical protein